MFRVCVCVRIFMYAFSVKTGNEEADAQKNNIRE